MCENNVFSNNLHVSIMYKYLQKISRIVSEGYVKNKCFTEYAL